MTIRRVGGSFRDPSGFVFHHRGVLYRHVASEFGEAFDSFVSSGLYDELVDAGLLVAHEEVRLDDPDLPPSHAVLKPIPVPFVSYPYEWSFSQWKAAALTTLETHRRALLKGFCLRDASAYNVQFFGSRPVLIDTLSFGPWQDGQPWSAYGQFCRHFLAPLALMARCDVGLGQLARVHIDGIPLPMASTLLPRRTWLRPGLLTHVHLHARSVPLSTRRAPARRASGPVMTRNAMLGLVEGLTTAVSKLRWNAPQSPWSNYYAENTYSDSASAHKETAVAEFLDQVASTQPVRTIWDLGANTGRFTALASRVGAYAVAFDSDLATVERHYRACAAARSSSVLPLVQDLANPSADIGWNNSERDSLISRGPADVAMALALVHHLAIGNNVPLQSVARFLARVAQWAVVEFVPKTDPQVQRLLATRDDIFTDYCQASFERAFQSAFVLRAHTAIAASDRSLYLWQRHSAPGNPVEM